MQRLGHPGKDRGCLSLGCPRVLCVSQACCWLSWGYGWWDTGVQAAPRASALMTSVHSVSTATRGPSCWR